MNLKKKINVYVNLRCVVYYCYSITAMLFVFNMPISSDSIRPMILDSHTYRFVMFIEIRRIRIHEQRRNQHQIPLRPLPDAGTGRWRAWIRRLAPEGHLHPEHLRGLQVIRQRAVRGTLRFRMLEPLRARPRDARVRRGHVLARGGYHHRSLLAVLRLEQVFHENRAERNLYVRFVSVHFLVDEDEIAE